MASVVILSWTHPWGVVENLMDGVGQAIERVGFQVRHLRHGAPSLTDDIRAALADPDIAFVLSFGTTRLFELNGEPIWNYFPARLFVSFQDPPIYELTQIQTMDLLAERTGRVAFGATDRDYLDMLRAVVRVSGGEAESLFFPVATPRLAETDLPPWRERPYRIMYFGAVGAEVFHDQVKDGIAETFADYRNGFVPFDLLVSAVEECLAPDAGGNVTAHLLARLGAGTEMLREKKWCLLLGRADSFVKRQRKLAIVRGLAGHGLHLFGHGWERIVGDVPGVELHGPLTRWEEHFEMIRRSRLTLNIDPNFNQGVNDRAFSSTIRGSGLLTQDNPFTRSLFGESALYYDQSGHGIGEVLARPDGELEAMAVEAQARVRGRDTWDHRIAELVAFMRGLDENQGRPRALTPPPAPHARMVIRKIKRRPLERIFPFIRSWRAR